MAVKWSKLNRKTHYWGGILSALPVLLIIVTGIILLLKKELAWVQPPTQKGETAVPALSFPQILEVSKEVEEAQIASWEDVDRLDVRPNKGVIKVRSKNGWEIQLDQGSGEVLYVAYRRNEWIESIHDGSIFGSWAKYGAYLPSAIILLVLWCTGLYLFFQPRIKRRKNKKKKAQLLESK